MRRVLAQPRLWLALFAVPFLVACEDKKSSPTTRAAEAPSVSDLRVRQESGGFSGAPTRFVLTLAFSDADADVAAMEVRRQDTGETSSVGLPDAGGKVLGLAEAVFEITAAAPGNIPMTVALLDAGQLRSEDLPFVIGVQAPPPPDEEPPAEDMRKQSRLRILRAHVRSR
jgi:hypothetical protein